ncbi:hypothetical protein GCM10011322_47910 [Salinarimonas ramus]|uniref:Uncharacterized protein n=1 Tax=Salinarimonas ramus TaxID=690164 RepID=A0A917VAM5_9HYPH|nr:hypothetical protein GCM10011322_47910 [Salinarimonas ramus]
MSRKGPEAARDVHYPASFRFTKQWKHRLYDFEGRKEVDFEKTTYLSEIRRSRRSVTANAGSGIFDEYVETTKFCSYLPGSVVSGLRIPDVQLHEPSVDTMIAQAARSHFASFSIPGADQNGMTIRADLTSCFVTDALVGARYQYDQ